MRHCRHVYGVPETLTLERSVQTAVDLAWEADPDFDDVIVVEEWEEGVPHVVPARLVARWNIPNPPGLEAPPLAEPAHRVEAA